MPYEIPKDYTQDPADVLDFGRNADFDARYKLWKQGLNPGFVPNVIDPPVDATKINPFWENLAKEQLARGPRANPYNSGIADQSRAGQVALYQQMRAARAGPSIAAMQGAGAQGQNVRAAMQGGSGVARMAAQQGAGMGGDVSQAVLGEQMRASQGLGGLAGGLRGRDLQGAQSQAEAALRARALDNAARQFYGAQGAGLSRAQDAADVERVKLFYRLKQQGEQRNQKTFKDAFDITSGILGGVAGTVG